MALQDILDVNQSHRQKKVGISPERIEAIKPVLRQYIAFWREYPDLFLDFLQTGGDPEKEKQLTFRLYFYQRVVLRVLMRYKYTYMVCGRGFSKSFLSVLVLMLRAILYPGAQLSSTAGGKQQSNDILVEKIEDLCIKIPSLAKEIDWSRGATKSSKDSCEYTFKNGSKITNLAASERTRGQRRHSVLVEECIGVDQKMLQDVIIPTMVVSRRCASGEVREDEVLNQSQVYVTTSGYKNTFSYDKLIQLLVRMVTKPDRDSFILGSSWRIPVLYGLQPKTFLQDLKNDSTFNEASFEREYESRWTGVVDDAFFDGDKFDKCRKLNQPELEETGRKGPNGTTYYIIGADFARKGDQSEFSVIKVMPQPTGRAHKNLVNIISLEKTSYKQQAIVLKKLFYKYKARKIVLDANGPGLGFVEFMLDTQVLPDGSILPPFGVENDPNGDYKGFRTDDMEINALYLVTANAAFNTECHINLQSSISSGTVKFLISARDAKEKLLVTRRGQAMNDEERAEYLKPFTATDILREQLMNLREEHEGINIILKQANRKIKKDKVSSLEYALYWIKQEEDMKARKRKKFKASDWMLMN